MLSTIFRGCWALHTWQLRNREELLRWWLPPLSFYPIRVPVPTFRTSLPSSVNPL